MRPLQTFDVVEGYSLIATPTNGEGDRILGLEDLLVPAVLLETDMHEAELLLRGLEATNNEGIARVEVAEGLHGDIGQDQPNVGPGKIPGKLRAAFSIHAGKFLVVGPPLFLNLGLELSRPAV